MLLFAAFGAPLAADEPLTIAYPERRPYHFTDSEGGTGGTIVDIVSKALDEAGIKARFVAMPPQRILSLVRQQDSRFCTISWFSTPERRNYARFSVPILQDAPHVLVTRPELRDELGRFRLLKDISFERPIRIGVLDRVSYGPYIDKILRLQGRGFTIVRMVNNDANMYRMLDQRRFDMMIATPLDLETGLHEAGLTLDHVTTAAYDDIPPGGKRRVMCTQAVDPALLDRLDEALIRHVPPGLAEGDE